MKIPVFLFVCLTTVLKLTAADGDYSVAKLPASLIKGAYAVQRLEETRFEVEGFGRSRLYKKYAITILSENGDRFSNLVEPYDLTREVKSIDGALYDAFGKKIKSLKKSDIKDVSGSDDSNLADDQRLKIHSFNYTSYPYTIEYEVEVKYDGTFSIPDFYPQYTYNLAVQQARLTIVCPESFKISYRNTKYK
jgi:hypothetical protein